MSRRHVYLAVGLLSVLCSVSARADAGTPLFWTATFHLFLGNALIGLCEGLVLARVFGLQKQGCVRLMIAANYLSAWIGVFLVPHLFSRAADDIYSGLWVTWLRIAATYLVTLVVEWPFVAMCFRKSPGWLRYGYGMLAFGKNQMLESNGSRGQSAERAIPTTQ